MAKWLTTIDNPWDPRDEFLKWLNFDIAHGYKTCEILDEEARLAGDLSNADNRYYNEDAIDRLVKEHPELYKVVEHDD